MIENAIIQQSVSSNLEYEKSSQKEISNLYETMLEDLKAAQVLYKEKCYPQALFHLQQSVEKGWKAYAKNMSILDNVKSIGHNIISSFDKKNKCYYNNLAKIISYVPETPILIDFFKEIGINPKIMPDALLEHVTQEREHIKEIANHGEWSAGELDEFLSFCDTVSEGSQIIIELLNSNEILESPEAVDIICKNVAPTLNEFLYEFVKSFSVSDEKKRDLIIHHPSEDGTGTLWNVYLIKIFMVNLGCFFMLAILNIILDSQFSKLRYPTSSELPRTTYVEDHEIVKRMPKLFELTKRTTEILSEHLKDNQCILGAE